MISDAESSPNVTGGECPEYESNFHRGRLIRDYWRFQLHVVELQTTIRATINFPFTVQSLELSIVSILVTHVSPTLFGP